MEKESKSVQTEGPADQFKTAQEALNSLENMLDSLTTKLADIKTDEYEAVNYMEKILDVIPKIRKIKFRLRFEKSLKSYKDRLISKGINQALLAHIVQKQRDELSKKIFELDCESINTISGKLGLHNPGDEIGGDIFSRFRILLSQAKSLDEIEAIIRKVKAKLDLREERQRQLKKTDLVRYFVDEAGFDEKEAVTELLLNKTLAIAIGSRVVTEERLTKELRKIKGDFGELSRQIIEAVNKKVSKVHETIGTEAPVWVRIFSNYVVNPVAGTSGVMGMLSIIIYTLGRFIAGPVAGSAPHLAEILEATNIPGICGMLNPQPVYIVGFSAIFIAGFLKMIDDKLIKSSLHKRTDINN